MGPIYSSFILPRKRIKRGRVSNIAVLLEAGTKKPTRNKCHNNERKVNDSTYTHSEKELPLQKKKKRGARESACVVQKLSAWMKLAKRKRGREWQVERHAKGGDAKR